MLKSLYDKCIGWAGYKNANKILALISFLESFIFPIPTDVMIIPMVIAKKEKYLRIASISIVFSVLGALIGYIIGYLFFNEVGEKIFELFGSENADLFKKKLSSGTGIMSQTLILFVAGFTPLPFKIITISCGFINLNIFIFILTCFIARGLRFSLVVYLTYKYGPAIGPFIEKKSGKWTIIISAIIVILALIIYFLIK
tara:strand:- start:1064 stop:1660 length:597 start_codon:yes stop_codon:yes gene_type:complete